MLRLSGGGQSFELPVFVDQTTGGDAQFSPFRLAVCFGAPDVPAGTPGRATAGAKFVELGMSTTAIVSPTATGEFDTVSTNAKGRFVKTLTLRKPSSFMAEVTIPLRTLGTADTDVRCATITVGGSHVLSGVERVR
jgi:hypothetical protein